MKDTTYNGWTNYATWRVNLEMFDNIPLEDFDGWKDGYDLAHAMQERVEYYIECSSDAGFARDFALAFLSDVNWREIADFKIKEYAQ